MLFEKVVCLDDNEGSCRFEPDAALDTDDGIADVNVAAYSIRLGDGLQQLNGLDRIGKTLAVDGPQFALLEFQLHLPRSGGRDRSWPGLFGQILPGGQRLFAADRSTPK